ncbi:MAG: hypothetical protein AAGG45_01580 [Pseudomonadota bacterium]
MGTMNRANEDYLHESERGRITSDDIRSRRPGTRGESSHFCSNRPPPLPILRVSSHRISGAADALHNKGNTRTAKPCAQSEEKVALFKEQVRAIIAIFVLLAALIIVFYASIFSALYDDYNVLTIAGLSVAVQVGAVLRYYFSEN